MLKRKCQKGLLEKYTVKKKATYKLKKKERGCMTRVIHGQKQCNSPPKKDTKIGVPRKGHN